MKNTRQKLMYQGLAICALLICKLLTCMSKEQDQNVVSGDEQAQRLREIALTEVRQKINILQIAHDYENISEFMGTENLSTLLQSVAEATLDDTLQTTPIIKIENLLAITGQLNRAVIQNPGSRCIRVKHIIREVPRIEGITIFVQQLFSGLSSNGTSFEKIHFVITPFIQARTLEQKTLPLFLGRNNFLTVLELLAKGKVCKEDIVKIIANLETHISRETVSLSKIYLLRQSDKIVTIKIQHWRPPYVEVRPYNMFDEHDDDDILL